MDGRRRDDRALHDQDLSSNYPPQSAGWSGQLLTQGRVRELIRGWAGLFAKGGGFLFPGFLVPLD